MNIFKDDAAHPFLIEPITLAHDLTLYCSIRFMSSEYPAHDEPPRFSQRHVTPFHATLSNSLHCS